VFKEFLIKLVATGFGVGYIKYIPGTAGSFLGVLFYLVVLKDVKWWVYLLVLFGLLVLGIKVSSTAERIFQKKDSQKIVIDEITGYLISMFLLPPKVLFISLSFVLFRILDILKPYPLSRIQRLRGGFGVMLDDFFSGVLTNAVLQLVYRILNQ
jgi:phosphatidylglycerophosphatase A